MELAKSVIFMAFLHVSFKKNWRLNELLVVLCELLLVLFVVLLFVVEIHIASDGNHIGDTCAGDTEISAIELEF